MKSRIDLIGLNGNDGEHYTEMPTLNQIKEMRRKLDEQEVPREDRCFSYTDLNGYEQIINHNSVITIDKMKLMPDRIKALFICGDVV